MKEIETATPGSQAKIYILIALAVILFNLVGIFGSDILLHDDPGWYASVLAGKFPTFLMKYSALLAQREWLAWNIMAVSPQLARGIYVLFLMVPISWCFYYLLHSKFGFSRGAAVTAAVLPNILPYQWQIPAGINMSYTLWGLLFALFTLILGFHYLENTTPRNWLRLGGTVLCYFIATQMTEQGVFLFPPLFLAYFGYSRWSKKHLWLISLLFGIAATKLIHIIISPRRPTDIAPPGEMFERIGLYVKWSLPAPDIAPVFPFIICLALIGVGYLIYSKDPGLYPEVRIRTCYLYSFFIGWEYSNWRRN